MAITETRPMTADDLLQLDSEGVRGELIRGVLHETMVTGERHGQIAGRLGAYLIVFIETRRLGTCTIGEAGVLLERNPDTVRAPDFSFTSVERRPLGEGLPGFAEVIPDLVVEVVSPSDSLRKVHEKALMWLSYGVRLVWVVHPQSRTVDVYRPDSAVTTLGEGDALDGLDVLPGFTCPLSTVFDV